MIGRGGKSGGCIALPEEIQQDGRGSIPGVFYEIEVTDEGAVVLLPPQGLSQPGEPTTGARCG